MGLFSLIKDFIEFKKCSEVSNVSANNSHNITVSENSTANINQKHSHNNYFGDVVIKEYENAEVVDNDVLKGRITEIRKLIEDDNSKKALTELIELQSSFMATGVQLTVNDRFSILINIYTCYINLGNHKAEMLSIENTIRNDLNNADEYYKFKYLFALSKFKADKAYEIIPLCQEILDEKPDYFKARILMLVAQSISKEISYAEAISIVDEQITSYEMTIKEKAYAIIAKGDIALHNKLFDDAIQYYKEGFEVQPSLNFKVGIAMAYYTKSIRNADSSGFIKFTRLDFESLHQARLLFDEIYLEATETKNTVIQKEILPYYMNSLEFTEESDQILDLRKEASDVLDFSQRNLAIITAHAEMFSGGISEETIEKLSGHDRLKVELKQLAIKGDYEDVNKKITPLMDSVFRDDEAMIAMYLISLFRSNKENFISEFKRYRENFKGDIEYELIWIQYLEYSDKVEEAKDKLKRLVQSRPEPIVVLDAYLFFERHKFDDELFELSNAIVSEELSVRPVDLPQILKKHFFILLDKKEYDKAEDFFKSLDFKLFKPVDALQLEVEFNRMMGQLDVLADKILEYAKMVNDNRFVVNSASIYAITNQLPKAIRLLEDLQRSGNYEKSELYMTLSRLYIIAGDNEKAFESASKAKEIDRDLYKSPSHSFFVMTGLRVNKNDDSVKHMVEYHEKFPKEDWVRSGKILIEDDEGNDTIDQEALEKLIGDRSNYYILRDHFHNYRFGLSTYMHLMQDIKLDFIFGELRYLNKKIKICEGVVEKINESAKVIENKILVDSIALYVLADAGILDILKEFEEVQVSYVTFEYLEAMLMQMESAKVRNILKFISDSLNVKLVGIRQGLFKKSNHFFDETVICMNYSYENQIPFLTGEYNLKNAFSIEGQFVVDIPSVFKALSERSEDTRKKCTECIEKLINKDYTFISFGLSNMLDTFEKSDGYSNIHDAFKVFLSMSIFSDYQSFINIYIQFLHTIEDRIDEENYMKFVDMIFDYLDWYVGRTRYYFNLLEPKIKELDENDFYYNRKWLCASIMVLSVEVDKNIWSDDYKSISRDPVFQKYYNIVSSIMSGVYAFLLKYKGDQDKYKFYFEHLSKRFSFIEGLAMKLILAEMGRHDERFKEKGDSQL